MVFVLKLVTLECFGISTDSVGVPRYDQTAIHSEQQMLGRDDIN